jgi:CMP-N-acetylneuraminic acid synthetase
VDVARREVIMEKNSMTGDTVLGMVMDGLESVNVDHEEDFLLAEALLAKKHGKANL